jgi:hypothetical protein
LGVAKWIYIYIYIYIYIPPWHMGRIRCARQLPWFFRRWPLLCATGAVVNGGIGGGAGRPPGMVPSAALSARNQVAS